MKEKLKIIFFYVWRVLRFYYSDGHLNSKTSKIHKIPFIDNKVYLRPSKSDIYRIREYFNSEYINKSYLNDYINKLEPLTFIDLGANIGIASLLFVNNFPSINRVYGVEFDKFNYEVLQKNYHLWQSEKNINFTSINAVAHNKSELSIYSKPSLRDLEGKYSASGTLRVGIEKHHKSKKEKQLVKTISINSLFKDYNINNNVIVKIDIEGSESELFEKNTEWMSVVNLIVIETHDHFHKDLMYTSQNLIKSISKLNFALIPQHNTMLFYNLDNLK